MSGNAQPSARRRSRTTAMISTSAVPAHSLLPASTAVTESPNCDSCTCSSSTSGRSKKASIMFREGDEFNAIAAVRGGTVKTYVIDLEGREQVQGFFLPGEVIGLSAISQAPLSVQCRCTGFGGAVPILVSNDGGTGFADAGTAGAAVPALEPRHRQSRTARWQLLCRRAHGRVFDLAVAPLRRTRIFAEPFSAHHDAHGYCQLPASGRRKRQPRISPLPGRRTHPCGSPRPRAARPRGNRGVGEKRAEGVTVRSRRAAQRPPTSRRTCPRPDRGRDISVLRSLSLQ